MAANAEPGNNKNSAALVHPERGLTYSAKHGTPMTIAATITELIYRFNSDMSLHDLIFGLLLRF